MTQEGRKLRVAGGPVGGLDRYVEAVASTLRVRRLADRDASILVAVSAGPDSTALLAALAALRDAGRVGPLHALHIDHGLRAGGAEDAAACREACLRLGVPFASTRVLVAPGNVQAAARRARYAALSAEAERVGADRIATGHTRTDQAETVLLRLLRGAGARGLSGIPARRGRLIRPLLDRSRQEGLDYLRRLGLGWRDDPSNATPRFARNRLRQRLWPVLLELAPAVEAALARTADLLRDDERALDRRARAVILAAGGAGPEVARLRGKPPAVQRRVVRRLATAAGGRAATPEARHVEAALALLGRHGPARASLAGGLEAARQDGRLVVRKTSRRTPRAPAEPVEVPGPGRYRLGGLGPMVEVLAPAAAGLPWPLWLRTRRPGDRFRPAGGAGSKKLKAWLIDRKVPQARRDLLLLLVAGEGAAGAEVLAIPELGARAAGLPEGVLVRLVEGV
jgi:tRNA(Ile)-lysidine synthase